MKGTNLNLRRLLLVLGALALWLIGCSSEISPVIPTPLRLTPTLLPAPFLLSTPTVPPMSQLISLRLWVPDFLDPYAETSAEMVLLEQLDAFNEIYPDVQAQVIVKKSFGPGGLYSLLSTAYAAAPDVLPDLIILNHSDLQLAIEGGFVLALENVVLAQDDFFPFALNSVQHDDQIYAIPFLTQAEQMAYRSGVSVTPPFSWTDVLTKGYSLLFPAAPLDDAVLPYTNDALLAAYLGTNGLVQDADGNPDLDPAALESVYQFFADLMVRSLINTERALALSNATECWATYEQGIGRLTPVPMGLYWDSAATGSAPGWMPTPKGQVVIIAHPWSLAVVAINPEYQEAASQLALWLTSPQPMGEIARSVQLMPTRASALDQWALLAEDMEFVSQLLASADLPLPLEIDLPVRRALQAGLRVLLSRDVATPEEAAAYALMNLRK